MRKKGAEFVLFLKAFSSETDLSVWQIITITWVTYVQKNL